jgi:putative resolvase
MKLTDWAKDQGIAYITAYRWWRNGTLPVPAEQTKTGTIMVHPVKSAGAGFAIYARVSSSDQKSDLEHQLARLVTFASENKISIVKSISEIGSGSNGQRPRLLALLKDAEISGIIVEHRDRLARFGSEYIEAALNATGRKLVILESMEIRDDLVQDMLDVMTSFCAKLYGRRSAKNRAKRALEAAAK